MNYGSCVHSRVDDGIDLSESIKDGAIEAYDMVTSVVQTAWRIIAGAIKWAVPCMILVGVVIVASILYQLGLCNVIGQPLKDSWDWMRGRSVTSQGAEPLLSGSY